MQLFTETWKVLGVIAWRGSNAQSQAQAELHVLVIHWSLTTHTGFTQAGGHVMSIIQGSQSEKAKIPEN